MPKNSKSLPSFTSILRIDIPRNANKNETNMLEIKMIGDCTLTPEE